MHTFRTASIKQDQPLNKKHAELYLTRCNGIIVEARILSHTAVVGQFAAKDFILHFSHAGS
jgi:hypothetical protein